MNREGNTASKPEPPKVESSCDSTNKQAGPTPESHLDTHAVVPKNSVLRSSTVKEGYLAPSNLSVPQVQI